MDVAGFRVPDTPRQQRNEDVATDSRRAQPVTMFRNSNSDKQPTPVKCRAALDSDAISHELVGSTIGISPPVPVKPLMGAPRTRRYDEDLSRASYFSKLTQRLQHHGPEKKSRSHTTDTGNQTSSIQQNDQQQAFDVGADFRGIQDVIAIKLRDLEKKLQQQEQVITELQFSLNDAKTATDTLETEKRQLRLKNEQLELKIKEGSKEALTLRQEKLEQAPRESPEMVAKLSTLEQQIRHLEDERNEKETQIVRLEESYKERTKALICASDKFAADIVQLTSTFSQREEEYRRAVDCASDLAVKEANRAASENKQEFQRELQQERSRRQALEKELRQAKQDLFVTEEKSRRSEQVHEALGKKLIAAELGSKAVTAHLEEKARALELRLDRDSAGMTQLKVALAEKEMDYANLRSSMEAYEQRIHVLIEHLRCWAQDYAHIGAIRSRLEMLGQIDQSCAATARMREAEQIDIVLAQLRQYCSRQSAGERRIECSPDQTNVSIPQCASDQDHEQNILDLSTFLNAAVATRQSAGHKRGKEVWSEEPRDAILDTSSVRAPSTGSSWKTTPVVKPPAVSPQYTGTKSEPSYPPTVSSSVVLKHTQGKRRAVAPQKAAMRRPVSPTAARTARRIKRKRPETDSAREDASVSR
ncbi:hypothetical protein SEPCBS119000_001550 [Sporothrix epigloea]|uniref:Uncharacterized protein n=1 Tax=Sporothrix epigloea TaxID=1892477 RepID=A0ABP0DCI5_9PEZI